GLLLEVFDNLLHNEISMVASSIHSKGKSRGVPAENGHVAPPPNLSSVKCQLFLIFRQ
ncbi:hypothetical protein J1N35_005655, partial [Gossypium stocksii]